MAATILSINDWLEKINPSDLILDVRSPKEFNHAHIPHAHSFPLFTDDERKIVGTTYKQNSREAAIKIGLDFFGGKMKPMVEQAEAMLQANSSKNIFVHCWRGGMRSNAVAWLLDLYGFKVYLLKGGYKAYRNCILQQFEKQYSLQLIGGKTGSGKTLLIQYLQQQNIPAIDLEKLAHHKGSAFGALGEMQQPTQEQFENNLAAELSKFQNLNQPIFLEDESQRIGNVNIPKPFFTQLRNAEVWLVELNFEERLKWIMAQYAKFEVQELINATDRIKKRLGGLQHKIITTHLQQGQIEQAFHHLLTYYDQEYQRAYQRRENLKSKIINSEKFDASYIAHAILQNQTH
jgi:tRNA 2-selenouridine synthase